MKRILLLSLLFVVLGMKAQINLNTGSTTVGTAPVSTFFPIPMYSRFILSRSSMPVRQVILRGLPFMWIRQLPLQIHQTGRFIWGIAQRQLLHPVQIGFLRQHLRKYTAALW